MAKNLVVMKIPFEHPGARMDRIQALFGPDFRVLPFKHLYLERGRYSNRGSYLDQDPERYGCKPEIDAVREAALGAENVYVATVPGPAGDVEAAAISKLTGLGDPWRIVIEELTKKGVQRALVDRRRLDSSYVDSIRAYEDLTDEILFNIVGHSLESHPVAPTDFNQFRVLRMIVDRAEAGLPPHDMDSLIEAFRPYRFIEDDYDTISDYLALVRCGAVKKVYTAEQEVSEDEYVLEPTVEGTELMRTMRGVFSFLDFEASRELFRQIDDIADGILTYDDVVKPVAAKWEAEAKVYRERYPDI